MSTELIPSVYQQNLYDFVKSGKGSAVVTAVAGSGKTTTILEALNYLPAGQTAQLFAFNTAIAAELKQRIPHTVARQVRAATFHSVGYRALCRHFNVKSLDTNSRKSYQLCKELIPNPEINGAVIERVPKDYQTFASKLVSLVKGEGFGALYEDDPLLWYDLVAHHGLEDELDPVDEHGKKMTVEQAVGHARALLKRSIDAAADYQIDFDDQLYLPILWNLHVDQTDWVFVDEAQDTNPIRRALAGRVLRPGGRMVAVGDPRQAIYGFTGASHDAIDLIREQWNCIDLPLSVCYRCPTKVIEHAQQIVDYIEPAPGAREGIVDHLRTSDAVRNVLTEHDAVLCRNVAPLVTLAYWALARGISCQLLGRDIGKNLQVLIDKITGKTLNMPLDDFETKLEAYKQREIAKLLAKDQHGRAESLQDRIECLQVILLNLPEDDQSLAGLGQALARLFSDDIVHRLTLSTIHKAKGKQWPQVAILRPELMPSFYATQDWEKAQEENIRYVAYTRAQEALYFLDDYTDDLLAFSLDQPISQRKRHGV